MGFGGAGVFLSIALAEVMDANYDDCRRYSDTGSGDGECSFWRVSIYFLADAT